MSCANCRKLEKQIAILKAEVGRRHTKLTEEQVREMRVLRAKNPKVYSYEKLAGRFNISKSAVGEILSGSSWRHV